MSLFKKAERKRVKLRLGLCGPSGSGKTQSALRIASGLAGEGKIYVIDTEKDSAELEAGKPGIPDFLHAPIAPPYTPERYCEYIKAAADEGATVIVIDSLTHAWSGDGGVLDMHAIKERQVAGKGGNGWTAWRDITPAHNKLVETILACPCHVICTTRTKTAWEVVENDRGKKVPQKIGLKPEQREGMEYEFTCVLDLSVDGHYATSSKDRTSLFDGKYFIPSKETGEMLLAWLSDGKEDEYANIVEQLKGEIAQHLSLVTLDAWGKDNAEKINSLPKYHCENLRSSFRLRAEELGRKPTGISPATLEAAAKAAAGQTPEPPPVAPEPPTDRAPEPPLQQPPAQQPPRPRPTL